MPGNMDFNNEMNHPMPKSLDKEFKRMHTAAVSAGTPVSERPALERFPFEAEFLDFQKSIRSINASAEEVDGKTREYVTTSSLYPAYEQAFGNMGLVPTTINYRLHNIDESEFPNDFMPIPGAQKGESAYYVNRLNADLLKKIYLPNMKIENVSEDHAEDKKIEPVHVNVMDNINELEERRISHEYAYDEESMHDSVFEKKTTEEKKVESLHTMVVKLLNKKGLDDPQTKELFDEYLNQLDREAERRIKQNPNNEGFQKMVSFEVDLKEASLFAETERYKEQARTLLEGLEERAPALDWDYSEDLQKLRNQLRG